MTSESDPERIRYMRAVLESNRFPDPDAWLNYALAKRMAPVKATYLVACPDCDAVGRRTLAQYEYFSRFMHLEECEGCGLIYSDTRLDAAVVAEHFNDPRVYKDHRYFAERRGAITAHLTRELDLLCPPGGSVLDVGGATGSLMAELHARRPDARVVVNDISSVACRLARETHGLDAVCADMAALTGEYELVVNSDALYYAQDLPLAWSSLHRLVKSGGHLVLRIPNKLLWLRAGLLLHRPWRLRVRIRAFNVEQSYVFPRAYLRRRLGELGFEDVRFLGSPLNSGRAIARAAFTLLGPFALTPSVLVIARRR